MFCARDCWENLGNTTIWIYMRICIFFSLSLCRHLFLRKHDYRHASEACDLRAYKPLDVSLLVDDTTADHFSALRVCKPLLCSMSRVCVQTTKPLLCSNIVFVSLRLLPSPALVPMTLISALQCSRRDCDLLLVLFRFRKRAHAGREVLKPLHHGRSELC